MSAVLLMAVVANPWLGMSQLTRCEPRIVPLVLNLRLPIPVACATALHVLPLEAAVAYARPSHLLPISLPADKYCQFYHLAIS